jgi:DNA-binding NarL/FixJ family response regulator
VGRDNENMKICAVRIVLSEGELKVLTSRARRARGEQRDVLRARIVLAAAAGRSNAAIADRLAVTEDTVRK